MSAPLTPHEIRRIAGESLCDPRTVQRWSTGRLVKWTTAARLAEAARKLGIRIPDGAQLVPEPVTAP